MARPLADTRLTATAAGLLALAAALDGAVAEAEASLAEAAALAGALSDDELAPWVDHFMDVPAAEIYLDRYAAADAHAERALAIARATGRGQVVPILFWSGIIRVARGRLDDAAEVLDTAVEIARLAGHAEGVAWNLFARSLVATAAGDVETARATAEEVTEALRGAGPELSARWAAGSRWPRRCCPLATPPAPSRCSSRRRAAPTCRRSRARGSPPPSSCARAACSRSAAATMPRERPRRRRRWPTAWACARRARWPTGRPPRSRSRRATPAPPPTARRPRRPPPTRSGRRSRPPARGCLPGARWPPPATRRARRPSSSARPPTSRRAARCARATRPSASWGGSAADATGAPAAAVPTATGCEALTERELQVARLVVDRKTNPQIAAELFLSPKTVETHIRNLFHKLDVSSRVDVARAVERADREAREPAPR